MKKKIILLVLIICFILSGSLVSLYFFTKPNLMIMGSKEVDIPLNGTYEDEGAKLYLFNKDYSHDIKVTSNIDYTKVGSYKIKYSYKSKYLKESSEVVRIVNVVDTEKPVILLKGKDSYTIYYTDSKKASFKEKGYKAVDNYDGDITNKVEVIDEVDYSKKGTYKITYKVKDSSNNETSVERKIVVKKQTISASTSGVGRGLPILMYHFFYSEDAGEKGKDNNYTEIKAFEEQIKYISENNYYYPTWSEVRDFVDGKKSLPEKSIVITIDDWHKSVPKYAVPILNKYKVPATCFLVTVWETGLYHRNYASPYVRFGSHTHNMHRITCDGRGRFTCLSHDEALEDLKKSIEIVGNNDAIAYPFGHVNENVLSVTKEAGYKVGVTTVSGKAKKGMDPYRLPRVRVSKGESLATFIKNLQ